MVSPPTSTRVELLNQIDKVNTKSTNLNGTYSKRSVFHHPPTAHQERLPAAVPPFEEKIRHISFFYLIQKKKLICKRPIFFVELRISKKNYLRGISFFQFFGGEINNFFDSLSCLQLYSVGCRHTEKRPTHKKLLGKLSFNK